MQSHYVCDTYRGYVSAGDTTIKRVAIFMFLRQMLAMRYGERHALAPYSDPIVK